MIRNIMPRRPLSFRENCIALREINSKRVDRQ